MQIRFIAAAIIVLACFVYCGKPGNSLKTTEKNGVKITYSGELDEAGLEFFTGFYSQLPGLISSKDSQKVLSFFSPAFVGQNGESLETVRKTLPAAYAQAEKIEYNVSAIQLFVETQTRVVAESRFETAVTSGENQVEKLQGKERIYWNREKQNWRIVHWETLP